MDLGNGFPGIGKIRVIQFGPGWPGKIILFLQLGPFGENLVENPVENLEENPVENMVEKTKKKENFF